MYTAIGLIVVYALIQAAIPLLVTSAANLTATEGTPTIIKTVAALWWVPIILVLVAVVTGGVGMGRRRGGSRRRRR